MKRNLEALLFSIPIIVASCNLNSHSGKKTVSSTEIDSVNQVDGATSEFTYKIIDAAENTFGYKIFQDNKILVNQPHIPGIAGVTGFKRKEDAIKVAELVLEKIKNNQMPPTVTTEELVELGVIKEQSPN